MNPHHVRTEGQALVYLLECSMATVEAMAMKKSRPKSEYQRQISIAQKNYDWVQCFKADLGSTRAADLINFNHSVAEWAKRLEA